VPLIDTIAAAASSAGLSATLRYTVSPKTSDGRPCIQRRDPLHATFVRASHRSRLQPCELQRNELYTSGDAMQSQSNVYSGAILKAQ